MTFLLAMLLTADPVPALSKTDPLTWTRADPATFGCFLEKSFGLVDARFGCKPKKVKGKAAAPADDAGPVFPAAAASQVNPLISQIDLAWENGSLQAVTLSLTKKMTPAEAKAAFHLPDQAHQPPNVMSIDVQDCSQKASCLLIQGFDHQGAGD